jgi:dolichyl-diphosphooligosaccharide--protein glycosyltransferase
MGLVAAALIAIIPGFLPRSVAGSYDNEAVAIFGLMLTLLTFVKAVQRGSLLWSLAASVSYFYTAASWGGHIIIPNLLALYMICLLLTGSVLAPPQPSLRESPPCCSDLSPPQPPHTSPSRLA